MISSWGHAPTPHEAIALGGVHLFVFVCFCLFLFLQLCVLWGLLNVVKAVFCLSLRRWCSWVGVAVVSLRPSLLALAVLVSPGSRRLCKVL